MTTPAHALEVERVALTELRVHPQNVRQGDVGAISASLEAHGQYRPLIVQRSTGYVLAGNHTYMGMERLGWTRCDVVYLEVDDEEALRILLVDNRTSDVASYDDRALAALLTDVQRATETGLEGTGWSTDELDDLLSRIASPTPPGSFPAIDPDTMETEHRCPSCGYEWSGKAKAGSDAPPDE